MFTSRIGFRRILYCAYRDPFLQLLSPKGDKRVIPAPTARKDISQQNWVTDQVMIIGSMGGLGILAPILLISTNPQTQTHPA